MGRRVFVGSVVAGLPLLALSTPRMAAQSGAGALHLHPDGIAADPVLEHICRQLAGLHNAIRRQPLGEHVRAAAAQLRTLAVYGRRIDVDAQMRAAVSALIERDGRDAVLYLERDLKSIRAKLKRFGAVPDERLLSVPNDLDYAARSAALDGLQRSGLTARWDRVATLLERGAPGIDRRPATIVRVRQDDADWWQGFCDQLWSEYKEVQLVSGAICGVALLPIPIVQVAAGVLCVAQELAALILLIIYAGYCLNSGLLSLII
jgi:hypothetical protein